MTTQVKRKVRHLHHFIGGDYVASKSGQSFDSFNPATGEVHATVALGGKDEIDQAVGCAKDAFDNGPWPRMSMKERCEILRRIGDLILSRKEELAQAETLDTGKPITESLTGDIPRSALNFHFFSDFAQSLSDEVYTSAPGEKHIVSREPLGVVGLITPWNLPLYLATWKIAPCLAMGNTCVLKPAEWTPYTAFLLADIVSLAGLPKGVLNIVHGLGADSAGEALTRHPDVRAISFTGETGTGRAIMGAASSTLKKVSFELGGKGATVIFADADIDEAVETAVRAAYRNQGQICLAGSRLFVEEGVKKQVVDKLLQRVKAIRVGDPTKDVTQMGALISKEHLDKVEAYLEIGSKEGKLMTGGKRMKELGEGYFLSPSVFCDLPNDSKLIKEEIFGPVLPVVQFSKEEEVIKMVNDSPYGLSASVFSKDVDRCYRVSNGIRTGLVWVNCWFARDLRTPFGGMKSSGIGREGGRYSLEFFSEAKTISYKYKI